MHPAESEAVRDPELDAGDGFPCCAIVIADAAGKGIVAVGAGDHAVKLRPFREVIRVARRVLADIAVVSGFINRGTMVRHIDGASSPVPLPMWHRIPGSHSF